MLHITDRRGIALGVGITALTALLAVIASGHAGLSGQAPLIGGRNLLTVQNLPGRPAGDPTADGQPCTPGQLSIVAGKPLTAGGQHGVPLVFTNTATTMCRLTGYPDVVGLNPAGEQVARAGRTQHGQLGGLKSGEPPVIKLDRGKSASALVESADSEADTSCAPYNRLLVSAPDSTASTEIAWPGGCGALEVHPIVSGTRGSTKQ